jgi:dihydrofolate reductase
MRKLVYWMMVSLDGFVEGPSHELDWPLVDEELHTYINGEVRSAGALLYGRCTYELMAGYWPEADTYASSPPYEAEFARLWRELPKVVFSTTLEHAGWNTRIVSDNVADEIAELKAQPGDDLVLFGGPDVAATLDRLGAIDAYRLNVCPIVLGGGKPFFKNPGDRIGLTLVDTRTFGSGVVLLDYERA